MLLVDADVDDGVKVDVKVDADVDDIMDIL